ncbi:uncharacterized protein ACA1_181640 [Acanthamoeba castellanii str. Neff]|uniref:Uncharacterized protein n=1 Tax=Acanthamoeba castellanii (strain ATCC 30010 / Neff) TaxID=1257118 RepID=L8H7Z1_ACACF|nr:uncharacterized protein ACA1_181640 [Acanthamoeba castellanii str. Neff]ELR21275.1 hypothetical protein ACA1_181640 [Acanthamoeba castellanii str. Neff]
MEQPATAKTGEEVAAARKEELSALSTRQLLEELHLPLPLHYRAEDGLTLEAYKRKVLEVLLTRDIAAFTTEELSLFLRVCPKKANNSKPVEHAERALLARLSTLSKVELAELLKWVATSSSLVADKQQNQDKLIEALLTRKFEELEPADFFVIMPLCPPERQQQIMAHLYRIRQQLDSIQMLQLMKLYFVAPPSVEIQGLMNALYENEKRRKTSATRDWSRSSDRRTRSPILRKKGPNDPSRPISSLTPHCRCPTSWTPPSTQSSRLRWRARSWEPAATRCPSRVDSRRRSTGWLCSFPCLPSSAKSDTTWAETKPLFPLSYPLPTVGAVTAVRLIASVLPLEAIAKQYGTQPAGVLALGSQPGTPLAPSQVGGEVEVTVCFGETHVFRLQKEDTFDELLKRAARRWNVSPTYHELQDNNFRTLDINRPVADTMTPNAIIRLTRRGFADTAATPAAAAPAPALTSVFSPQRPVSNIFAQPAPSPFAFGTQSPLFK